MQGAARAASSNVHTTTQLTKHFCLPESSPSFRGVYSWAVEGLATCHPALVTQPCHTRPLRIRLDQLQLRGPDRRSGPGKSEVKSRACERGISTSSRQRVNRLHGAKCEPLRPHLRGSADITRCMISLATVFRLDRRRTAFPWRSRGGVLAGRQLILKRASFHIDV